MSFLFMETEFLLPESAISTFGPEKEDIENGTFWHEKDEWALVSRGWHERRGALKS